MIYFTKYIVINIVYIIVNFTKQYIIDYYILKLTLKNTLQ